MTVRRNPFIPCRRRAAGEGMGVTTMIPDATIGQLRSEAVERWGDIWDPAATRTRVLMMMPRKERKLYEMHGELVEHGQPVVSMFHRPRAEAVLLEEQGLNPRDASFLFVDLASSDLGRWLQHLVTTEGWLRSTLDLHPVPFEVGLPTQRRFEAERLLLFRHPSLPNIERYHLPFPLDVLPGKAYVSLPARAAAEHARQQAEVLGVGRLGRQEPVSESPIPVHVPPPSDAEVEVASQVVTVDSDTVPVPLPAHDPAERDETLLENVSRRVDEAIEEMVGADGKEDANPLIDAPVLEVLLPSTGEEGDAPPTSSPSGDAPPTAPPSGDAPSDNVDTPAPEEEHLPASEEDDLPAVEREFRNLVTELMAAGVEPGAMMDDPRWEDLNERAVAGGVDSWGIFVSMMEQQG